MKLISQFCKSLNNLIRSNYATATKTSSKKGPNSGNKNAKPEKQKLMKKQKLAASREIAANRRSGNNDRSSTFAKALFDSEKGRNDFIDSEEILRRQMIAKSWSRWSMLKLHQESEFEANYIRSKMRAMEELLKISPVLAEIASELSYEIAPVNMKPAAETKPDKLPFE